MNYGTLAKIPPPPCYVTIWARYKTFLKILAKIPPCFVTKINKGGILTRNRADVAFSVLGQDGSIRCYRRWTGYYELDGP